MSKSLRTLGLALFVSALTPAVITGCGDGVDQVTENTRERKGQFEIFEGEDGQFYFRLLAGNGENILRSEGYVRRSGAENGIASVKVNGIDAQRYDVQENVAGEHYFNLVARNGEIIGTSEGYASRSNAERGVETVVKVVEGLVERPLDVEVREAIETAVDGVWYGALHGSESDYPIDYVEASLEADQEITIDLIREKFGHLVDDDPEADAPLADMFGEVTSDWQTVAEICLDPEDAEYNGYTEDCAAFSELDAALGENLTDIQTFHFGTYGGPGNVEGVRVLIFIVGRTPDGKLAGVRTITIWT
jgi:uncharacterized protein YegP (UPF0339 family)